MEKTGSKRPIRIVVPIVVIIMLLPVGVGYIWFHNITRRPLPKHSGEFTVGGLHDKVEILRDERGIPHIYAKNLHDLFFAQGYTQAQDRWWQMEFWRYAGSGRIGELVGRDTSLVKADIFIRTVGWRRVAEQEVKNYDPEILAHLQAFADGVNAYIMNRRPGELALEYTVLGLTGIDIEIEPWTPVDSLVFAKIMAWDMGFRECNEAARARLYAVLGAEMTDQLLTPPWPYNKRPTIVQAEDLPIAKSVACLSIQKEIARELEAMFAEHPLRNMHLDFVSRPGDGSNNWVVSGKMTVSGKPLLANDPHLGIQMPSMWYQIGLHCYTVDGAPFNVTGFAVSASPGVIIGHNDRIGWALTNVFPDVHDLYLVRIHPDNPLQYEWNGEWRDMMLYAETVYFGDGAEPVTIEVRQTHLGPIINDNQIDEKTGALLGFNNETPVALRWTALDPGTLFQAVVGVNKATNWDEFQGALRYWDVPSLHFLYADVDGNIGYQMPGRIPIRVQHHSGLTPVPGWTDEFEWQGFIPYDKLPRVVNPIRGYIATANQAVVPPEYYDWLAEVLGEGRNYVFGLEWRYGYRGQRIVELLEEMAPHTIATFRAIQGDNKLISAKEVMPYLADLQFQDAEVAHARDWLLEWDYHCNVDSPEAALYAQFWASLMKKLYSGRVGDAIEVKGDDREMWATYLLLKQPDNPWWDDITTDDVVETRDDILIRSFTEGYANAVAALGKDKNGWRWGDLHTTTFVSNPLGKSGIGLIERMVNRGPFPTGGNTAAINHTRWAVSSASFAVETAPSMRMIVDFHDFSRSIAIHNTGQSGHPYSPDYDTMIEPWLNMEYLPMLWTREEIETAAVKSLLLQPGQ